MNSLGFYARLFYAFKYERTDFGAYWAETSGGPRSAAGRAVALILPHQSSLRRSDHWQREDARFRVLRLLEARPHLSQREISQELGVSLGAINYCLNALIEKGHVKVRNFRASDNKLRYAYLLTPRGVSERARLTGYFLQRKLKEYDALTAEIASLRHEMGTPLRNDG